MAIGGIIEMFAAGRGSIMSEQPKLSVFEKLKLKKQQQAEAGQTIQSGVTSPTVVDTTSTSTSGASLTREGTPSEVIVKTEQSTEGKETKKLPVINTELAPPNLPATELPIVSATPATKDDIL